MRIEDIKYEFPKMPEEMKMMVTQEVRRQVGAPDAETMRGTAAERAATYTGSGSDAVCTRRDAYAGSDRSAMCRRQAERTGYESATYMRSDNGAKRTSQATRAGRTAEYRRGTGSVSHARGRRRLSARRVALIGLAASMALGTTVFAGSRLYRMYSEQVGNYGVKTSVSGDAAAGTELETSGIAGVQDVPEVKLELGYVPEGLSNQPYEPLKYHYDTENGMQGGISFCAYSMDLGDDAFEITDVNITAREEIKDAEHDIIYLEKQWGTAGGSNALLYIFFPEVHHVLEMWVGPDVSKEEAIQVAREAKLVPLSDGESADIGLNWAWSSYIESQNETEHILADDAAGAAAGMTYAVGEAFPLEHTSIVTADGEYELTDRITAKVSAVETADDFSLLASEYIPAEWFAAVDDTGRLLPNELQYVRRGDGIETTDEILQTEEVPQKLVYATVEYTNTGEETVNEICFYTRAKWMCEDGDGYVPYDRAERNGIDGCDMIVNTGAGKVQYGDMSYFDLRSSGEHNGGNYIDVLNPGETVTVHMAWIVNEDELPYLYLNFGQDGVGEKLVRVQP